MENMTSEELLFKHPSAPNLNNEDKDEDQDEYLIFRELFDGPNKDDHGGTKCHRETKKPAPRKAGILPEEVAQALYAQAKAGNNAARKELIERFWPLCNRIAKQFRGEFVTHDEATSAAVTALIAAIDSGSFDPTKLDKRGKPIKLATYFWARLAGAVKREKTKRFAAYQTTPLDAPKRSKHGETIAPDDSPPSGAFTEAPPTAEEDLIEVEDAAQHQATILYSVNTLDPRERRIFDTRCLAEEDDRLKLRELAAEFGLSTERVRQIEVRTKKKIAGAVREQALRPRKLCDLGLTPAAAASLERALDTLTDCERHVFTCRRLTRFPARYAVIGRSFGMNGADCIDVEIEATFKVYALAPAALVQLRRAPGRRVPPVLRVLDEKELRDVGLAPKTAACLTPEMRGLLGWAFGSGRLVSSWPSEEAIAVVAKAISARRAKAAKDAAPWRAVLLRSRQKRENDALVQRRPAQPKRLGQLGMVSA